MTPNELQALWRPTVANLLDKLRLIADDAAGLDDPVWRGTFTVDGREVEEQMQTPRELMAHLVLASYEVPRALATGEGFERVRELAPTLRQQAPSQLAAGLEERLGLLETFLAELDEATLATVRETPFGQHTVASILSLAVLHVVHHKAQLMVCMRAMGIRPGRFL